MLDAEEKDNQRDRQWEAGANERDMINKDRLNEARFGMVDSPQSRGRGVPDDKNNDDKNGDMSDEQESASGYVSSSVTSSFDYRALTEEEK